MAALAERLAQLISAAYEEFPEVDVLRPGGELRVGLGQQPVDRVRIDLGVRAPLLVGSLDLVPVDGTRRDLEDAARVTASSGGDDDLTLGRLLDPPDGRPAFASVAEDHPWLEIALSPPTRLRTIALRSVGSRRAELLRDVRILVAAPGEELRVVHDAAADQTRLSAFLDSLVARSPSELREDLGRLAPLLTLALAGRYREARAGLKAAKDLSPDVVATFKRAVNEGFLMGRQLEWTSHGPLRSFRFWSAREKTDYVRLATEVADELTGLTPHVCFGFGAALAAVRDHDLIPHDDDLDLIVAFEPHEASSLPEALARVEEFLRPRGFTVSGDFFSHRHVGRAGAKKIDVFCGLFEGDRVSWYPGVRRGLAREAVFPVSHTDLLGVRCPLPADPETYLSTVYGTGWNSSDPGFKHSWRKRDWLDLGAPQDESAGAEPARRGWLDRLLRR